MSETVLGAVERLSRCIISGEVVFFIGSGFSIDSEGNTASRFMIRLLIRFSAMVHVLSKNAKTLAREISDPEKQKAAEELAADASFQRDVHPREMDPRVEHHDRGIVMEATRGIAYYARR